MKSKTGPSPKQTEAGRKKDNQVKRAVKKASNAKGKTETTKNKKNKKGLYRTKK